MHKIEVSEARIQVSSPQEAQTGLLGYVTFVINGMLRIDSVTLRRGVTGKLTFSFPERRDRQGKRHPIIRPLDTSARIAIEQQLFDQLAISIESAAI